MANYTIGRGIVYFAPFNAGTQVIGGFRDIGNAPEFTLTRDEETIEHYSSRAGLKLKDDSATLKSDLNGGIKIDDMSFENYAMYFYGTVADVASIAATALTETFTVAAQGLTYQLGINASRPTGLRKVASVVVTKATPLTTFVLGTDYTVDTELGLIYVIPGGAITASTPMIVTYNSTVATRKQVAAGTTAVEGALRLVGQQPKGLKTDWYMPWAKLKPSGDLSLIGDDWLTASFDVECLSLGTLAPLYIDGRAV